MYVRAENISIEKEFMQTIWNDLQDSSENRNYMTAENVWEFLVVVVVAVVDVVAFSLCFHCVLECRR